MREHRRSSRFPVDEAVELVLDDGHAVQGRCYNVSFEGVSVKLSEPPPRGARVRIRTQLPVGSQSRSFSAPCEVVHVNRIDAHRGYRVGLAFDDLGAREAEALQAFFGAHR